MHTQVIAQRGKVANGNIWGTAYIVNEDEMVREGSRVFLGLHNEHSMGG